MEISARDRGFTAVEIFQWNAREKPRARRSFLTVVVTSYPLIPEYNFFPAAILLAGLSCQPNAGTNTARIHTSDKDDYRLAHYHFPLQPRRADHLWRRNNDAIKVNDSSLLSASRGVFKIYSKSPPCNIVRIASETATIRSLRLIEQRRGYPFSFRVIMKKL